MASPVTISNKSVNHTIIKNEIEKSEVDKFHLPTCFLCLPLLYSLAKGGVNCPHQSLTFFFMCVNFADVCVLYLKHCISF